MEQREQSGRPLEDESLSPQPVPLDPRRGVGPELSRTRRELDSARAREARAVAEAGRLADALDLAERRVLEHESRARDLDAARHAQYWLDVVQNSISWRITRPLRWVARRLGR